MAKYHDRRANLLPDCTECKPDEVIKYGPRYYATEMRGSYGFSWYAVCRGCQQVYTMNGSKLSGSPEYGTAD